MFDSRESGFEVGAVGVAETDDGAVVVGCLRPRVAVAAETDAVWLEAGCEFLLGDVVKADGEVQAGVVCGAGREVTGRAHARYPVGDQLVTFGVDLAAPSQVTVEVAGGDEVVDCSLQQFGRLDVACGAECCGVAGQLDWEHRVPEPERRCEGLRERRDIHGATRGVEQMKRLERPVCVAVLGVVVVFDDRLMVAVRVREQRSTSGDGEVAPVGD